MGVCIHGGANVFVAHQILQDLGRHSAPQHFTTERMAAYVGHHPRHIGMIGLANFSHILLNRFAQS